MAKESSSIDHALPLLDFDWKLKYAVASGSMAAVNKPLLRLELCVSKSPTEVQKAGDRNYSTDNDTYTAISEYNKAELDILIAEMDAIGQALEGVESAT